MVVATRSAPNSLTLRMTQSTTAPATPASQGEFAPWRSISSSESCWRDGRRRHAVHRSGDGAEGRRREASPAPARPGPPVAPETYAYVRDEKTGAVQKVSLFSPDAERPRWPDRRRDHHGRASSRTRSHDAHAGAERGARAGKKDSTAGPRPARRGPAARASRRKTMGIADLPEVQDVDRRIPDGGAALHAASSAPFRTRRPIRPRSSAITGTPRVEWKSGRSSSRRQTGREGASRRRSRRARASTALVKQAVADKKAKGDEAAGVRPRPRSSCPSRRGRSGS